MSHAVPIITTSCRGKAPAKLDSLIASLDAKYVKSTARKGKGKREPSLAPEEPSDEQFEAARYAEYIAWKVSLWPTRRCLSLGAASEL